ncbi:hypothetical protein ACFQJ8_27100 [Halocatena marina]
MVGETLSGFQTASATAQHRSNSREESPVGLPDRISNLERTGIEAEGSSVELPSRHRTSTAVGTGGESTKVEAR